jgi:hypothetical protein
MRVDLSASMLAAGASNEPVGTHTSKTMMLPELRRLLSAAPGQASYDDYVRVTIEENALDKATAATRSKTLSMLRQLYALKGSVPVFAALRELWPAEEAAQPMLALLCAAAYDPLLRSTADLILSLRPNEPIGPSEIAAEVATSFPSRYKPGTLHHIGQNVGASWVQAGLLRGVMKKTRTRPPVTGPAVVYALYLGHLDGAVGPALFDTWWTRLLDTDDVTLRAMAETAARIGWLEYRSSGGMTSISFYHLDDVTGWAEG